MRLIPEWRRAWRYYSTQALIALAALPMVWAELPPEVKDVTPEQWRPWIVSGLAIGGLAGRLIAQRPQE